jgi:Raf kinase inhibitor-like YbhB/YbcL family protein
MKRNCAQAGWHQAQSVRPQAIKERFLKVAVSVLYAGLVTLSSVAPAVPEALSATFVLTSPAFADNAPLPRKFAGKSQTNRYCVGKNISPPLTWENPPRGTKSFALMLFDPEGHNGLGTIHWVAYGIPVTITGFSEGEVSRPSEKYVGGRSSFNVGSYSGPCTTPGGWHHYTFTLIATDLDPKALEPGLTRDELLRALAGHALLAAGLVGRFRYE